MTNLKLIEATSRQGSPIPRSSNHPCRNVAGRLFERETSYSFDISSIDRFVLGHGEDFARTPTLGSICVHIVHIHATKQLYTQT